MMADPTDLNDQDNIHNKHLHGLDTWNTNVGDSKFVDRTGLSGNGKDGNIWKQTEVSNVWGVTPVAGSTWGRPDEYSMFQGVTGDKTDSLKSYGNSVGWDNPATSGDQLGKSFAAPESSDVWRGFQEYDPFKRSWGEVDFTAATSNDKNNWNPSQKESENPADNQQAKSVGQPVQKSASMSEISLTVQTGGEVQPSPTTTEASPLPASLPFKSVSSGNFFLDPLTKPESERSQPDGAEVSQQNKEEIIAKMVNSHDGWGKKPIRQDTPWQTDNSNQSQPLPTDGNAPVAPGSVVATTDAPKSELGNNMWNIPEPLSGGGSSSWNASFFNSPSATFSGSNADWISDGDIGIWSGPPPAGCDNPSLWSGAAKDASSLAQPNMWSSNSSAGWPNELTSDRNPWTNDSNLGQFWNGPAKTPDEFMAQKKVMMPGQHGSGIYGGQNMKPIGMWGDSNSVQTETGYWNQPNSMMKADDLRQVMSGSNLSSTEKLLSMINNGGRMFKEQEPPRGRMLRGKSVIETSDYNQPYSGLQRGAGAGNFSTSAFQPPQQQQQQYNQQLQQQLLLQKAGLFGTGFQHGRSASHIPKMDNLSGMGLNQSLGGGPKNLNLIQNCLQLQSILQPLLVERSQLQQNKIIPLAQKKSKLDALNQDIAKVKAYIDNLQLMNGGGSQSIGSSFNQSDLGMLDEARLRQALGQMKMDPYNNSNLPLNNLLGLGNNNNTANDLAVLLQNVNLNSGNANQMNNWLPSMINNLSSGESNNFLQGQTGQQDLWGSYLGKSSGFVPPPPPGLGPVDKIGGSMMGGQQGFYGRSTSWAPGEKNKSGYNAGNITNWLLIKNTSSIDPQYLHSICGQCGALQQLLSNKLTGHSLACFKDDSLSVQTKLQQIGNLSSDCLSSQDVFNLLDANGCGGVAAAWVNVSASAASPPTAATLTTMASIASNVGGIPE